MITSHEMATLNARNVAHSYVLAACEDHGIESLTELSRRASSDFLQCVTAEGKVALAFAMDQIDELILAQL